MSTPETGICSICGKLYGRYGNNAAPVNDGRCCDDCNASVVVPKRIEIMRAFAKHVTENSHE